MSANRAVVDTNVLVYAHLTDSPHHLTSVALLDRAKRPDADLCIFPQMVAEFYATMTNPKRVTSPMSAAIALNALDKLLALPGITVLPIPVDIVARVMVLLRAAPVTGRLVFDYQIAAALLQAGISTLYTYNIKDFSHIPDISPVEPPALATA